MSNNFFRALLFSLLVLSTLGVVGQDRPEGVKRNAFKAFQEGNALVAKGDFITAIQKYTRAEQLAPLWADPIVKLAAIHFQQGHWEKSKERFDQALSLGSPDPTIHLKLGEIAWMQDDFEGVKYQIEKYLSIGKPNPRLRKRSEKLIRDAAFLIVNQETHPINVVALPPSINSDQFEYLPSINARSDMMVFTRRIRGQEDFMVSKFEEGVWQKSTPLSDLNTPFNEGAHCLSADGRMLVFTRCEGPGRQGSCDLFYSTFDGDKWTKPRSLGPDVNSKHWDGQPSLSPNGRTLYFASERSGGLGGRDLWKIDRKGGGWNEPVNLSDLNTPYNDEAPFIHAGNGDIYFMSDGHPGYGGTDLFHCRLMGSGWSTPTNMGAPINTKLDEGAIHILREGKMGYFARSFYDDHHRTTIEIDIYEFPVPDSHAPSPATYVQVNVCDAATETALPSIVHIVNVDDGKTLVNAHTGAPGSILICLPIGHDYALHVTKENYDFYSEHFHLADSLSTTDPVERKVLLHKIEEEPASTSKPIVLENVFFESGSAKLLGRSAFELRNLHKLLMTHPDMHIEIRGHTDDVGSEMDNQKLSELRAQAIYQYLTQNEVEEKRLSFIGFGEMQPIADNSTKEGRQKNRRTEFVIIANGKKTN